MHCREVDRIPKRIDGVHPVTCILPTESGDKGGVVLFSYVLRLVRSDVSMRATNGEYAQTSNLI